VECPRLALGIMPKNQPLYPNGCADIIILQRSIMTQQLLHPLIDRPFDELTPDEWQAVKDSDTTPPEIDIDDVDDEDFGLLYRVWAGTKLLGTYYRNLEQKWIAQADAKKFNCKDTLQAQLIILAVGGYLTADAA